MPELWKQWHSWISSTKLIEHYERIRHRFTHVALFRNDGGFRFWKLECTFIWVAVDRTWRNWKTIIDMEKKSLVASMEPEGRTALIGCKSDKLPFTAMHLCNDWKDSSCILLNIFTGISSRLETNLFSRHWIILWIWLTKLYFNIS